MTLDYFRVQQQKVAAFERDALAAGCGVGRIAGGWTSRRW
jgi:hypothetical protein